MTSREPQFSIILCSRNRAQLLRTALESVLAVDYPRDRFELLLVDNGSTDETASLVAEFERRAEFQVRYIYEGAIGLSRARNRAIREARGQYLFFTDDDQVVDKAVLQEYERVLGQFPCRVVQGAIELLFTEERPSWLHGRLAGLLGETRALPEGTAIGDLYGGNLLVKRDVFEQFAGFHEDFGKGRAGFSEDTEFAERLRAAGERIVFAPTARIYHVIGPERATVRFVRKTSFEKGRAHGRLQTRSIPLRSLAMDSGVRVVGYALRAAVFALRADAYACIQAQSQSAFDLGKLVACSDRVRGLIRP
jgi:glucosyl-dolichyl phosphate glucuronosyltransferase